MQHTTTQDVREARDYLDGLTDERAVQLHRWLAQTGGRLPDENPGQIVLDHPGVSA